jgi:recombinational DNA repair ATPase RecF
VAEDRSPKEVLSQPKITLFTSEGSHRRICLDAWLFSVVGDYLVLMQVHKGAASKKCRILSAQQNSWDKAGQGGTGGQ